MRVKKKILSLLLVGAMALGAAPFNSVVANAEDTGVKKIELKAGSVADDNFVYFGNYSGNIKWRVLDADKDNTGADGMFLVSEYLLKQSNQPFAADRNKNEGQRRLNEWQHSDAQKWCTTFAGSDAFTDLEKSAFKSVSKTDISEVSFDSRWGENNLSNEKVFYLSAAELVSLNRRANGLVATTSNGDLGGWWLRSFDGTDENGAGYVDGVGAVWLTYVTNPNPGVRPAFNLNLNSVLFTSAAISGKSSGTAGADALNEVSEYTSDAAREWKVTLLDTNRTFSAQAAEGAVTSIPAGYSSWPVAVTYSKAKTDTNEYVSAMLCDAEDDVLYYGNIAQSSASGTQTVNIPAGLATGNYTLKVFSEQLNGDKKTDYASAFQEISLEVGLPKAVTPSAVFTAISENGGALTDVTTAMCYSIDGGANWIDVTGTTMDITDVTVAKGVQVYAKGDEVTTIDSDIQTIAVTQSAQPVGLSKTDCTTAENNNGKISGVDNTMEYRVAGSADAWTSVAETIISGLSNQSYEVRVKANGTVLASEAVTMTIGEYVAPKANNKDKDNNMTSPQTGDSSNMFLWLTILIICAGGIVTIGIVQKTHKKYSER